jgi:flavin-dependent dehydrogenase
VEHFDAVIVGGGPAGSTCAWQLHRAGLDVAILDRAIFPRDKVCAGWITPPVVSLLELDVADYRHGRVFQPITAFRTSLFGRAGTETRYARAVSFGIRRYEFDDYLLRRSRARLRCGEPLSNLRRVDDEWVMNGTIVSPMIVGAGGHLCPAARWLNPHRHDGPVIAALEMEVPLDDRQFARMSADSPVLRFFEDLNGYGWCLRKENVLNVGLGLENAHELPRQARDFLATLASEHLIPGDLSAPLRGHAYLVASRSHRTRIGDGIVLAGDAAGLADPHSGEGIRPAIESGLLAAGAILRANGHYDRAHLASYEEKLRARFGAGARPAMLPPWLLRLLARSVMRSQWLTRHLVLDRWFLGRHRPPLATT